MFDDFWTNISRYPRYLVAITLGVLYPLLLWVKPLLERPVTAVGLIGVTLGGILFIVFTLRAMLGISPV
ncbi:MAG: DUF751 family protein [Kastovskya adunca ATA6-11-RM4]|jgi:hypothetical protein|nr:DUF751 family protein [Kastovskya adunca ATA6-11-RM4]